MFKVYDPKAEPEPVYYFQFCDDGYGSLVLKAVDSEGKRPPNGVIICITKDGVINLYPKREKGCGLKLDEQGFPIIRYNGRVTERR